MYIEIYEDRLRTAELFGKPVLIADGPVPRNIVPEGWYCCDLQGTKDNPYLAVMAMEEDDRYHCGTVLSPTPILDKLSQPKPLNGQFIPSEEKITLAEYCRQHGLRSPDDKRHFILCPDPLADAPPELEQVLRDTVSVIEKCGLYKEFLRTGNEDYYRVELSYILSAPEKSGPDRLSAVAVCLDADGNPDDDKTLIFQPHTDKEPVWLWGANFERDLFDELASGQDILYMSMGCHTAVWCHLEECADDGRLPDGAAKYLQYCADAEITPEKMREAEPFLESAIEAVAQMMEVGSAPDGMVMT